MPISRADTRTLWNIVRHMLHQVLHPAAKVGAELVQHVGLDVGAMVIGHFRQGHSVESGRLRNLLDDLG